jgi:hypothetical protein
MSKGVVKPSEILYWQKAHQPWKDQILHNKTIDQFSAEWWAWWKLLQLVTHTSGTEGELLQPTAKMNGDSLHKPGRNGFLLIMLSLIWWGKFSTV